ncbi:MAG TPA: carboxypeptidase-like regulatory domain-containing protein [Tepidisphaeraceae bacterium]|nr:carboxypeptidase-like regulatory domain-containing protein [Tepidisphaeraceae bacterium]
MIAAATLLFLGTEAVLYFRSATMREPRCVLVVETAPPLKGAQIKVDGFPLPRALTSTVGENGRFALPFYLDAGTYTVTVTLDGEPQFQGDVELTHASPGRKLDLTRIHPTPAATLPAPDVSSSVPGP